MRPKPDRLRPASLIIDMIHFDGAARFFPASAQTACNTLSLIFGFLDALRVKKRGDRLNRFRLIG
jgi:hypothetical protein